MSIEIKTLLFDSFLMVAACAIGAWAFGLDAHKGVWLGVALCFARLSLPRWS